jgi:hypothetical protein
MLATGFEGRSKIISEKPFVSGFKFFMSSMYSGKAYVEKFERLTFLRA